MPKKAGTRVLRFVLIWAVLLSASNLATPVSRAQGKDPFRELGIQLLKDRPPAPGFTLKSINGDDVRLSDLKGKVVLINFFATWCTPCRFEMPEMEALYKSFEGKDFVILAVSIDRTAAPIKPFADSMKLTFPIAHDPDMEVARRYGFRGPPLSYFIDRKGHVVGGAAGPRYWNAPGAHQVVQRLLEESAP